MEDDLWDARNALERLMQKKDQVSNALDTEKAKVISLSRDKSFVLEEKKLALQEKELALEAKRKFEEEKDKLDEE